MSRIRSLPLAAGLAVLIGACTKTVSVTPPTVSLGCAVNEFESVRDILQGRGGIVVVPVADCQTPLVLIPQDASFGISPQDWIREQREYNDGAREEEIWDGPGIEQPSPKKWVRGMRFRNDGSRSGGRAVSVVIHSEQGGRTIEQPDHLATALLLLALLTPLGVYFRQPLWWAAEAGGFVLVAFRDYFRSKPTPGAEMTSQEETHPKVRKVREDLELLKKDLAFLQRLDPTLVMPRNNAPLAAYEGLLTTLHESAVLRLAAHRNAGVIRIQEQVISHLRNVIAAKRLLAEEKRVKKESKLADLELDRKIEEEREKRETVRDRRRDKRRPKSELDIVNEIINDLIAGLAPGDVRADLASTDDQFLFLKAIQTVEERLGVEALKKPDIRRLMKTRGIPIDTIRPDCGE